MVSDPRQTVKDASMRSWNWVRQNSFQAIPFYKRSWELVKADPWIFLWKLLADFLSRTGAVAVAMFVLSLFAVDFQQFTSNGQSSLSWFARLAEIAQSPGFITGFVGVAFVTAILGVTIQAYVISGIWGLLATGLREEPIEKGKTFLACTWQHFPHVLGLFLLKYATHTVTLLLAVALIFSFINAGISGSFGEWSSWQKTLLLTCAASFFIAWLALTRLTLEVTGAPLVIDEMPLGESILEGATFVVQNFWAVYRLLIFSLGLLLIPLFGYWVLLMFNNLTLLWPILAPLGVVLRLVAEVFLWVSLSVLGVLFYGAIFAFYKKDDEAFAREEMLKKAKAHPETPSPGSKTIALHGKIESSSDQHQLFKTGTTLEDFLPEKSPYRFPAEKIFPPSEDENNGWNSADSSNNESEQTDKAEPAPPDTPAPTPQENPENQSTPADNQATDKQEENIDKPSPKAPSKPSPEDENSK